MSTAASPDALQAAWEAMRHRAACLPWPADFDQVMADPVRQRLVRLEATHRARAPQRPAVHRMVSRPMTLTPPFFFDHKRAAAGDRDD